MVNSRCSGSNASIRHILPHALCRSRGILRRCELFAPAQASNNWQFHPAWSWFRCVYRVTNTKAGIHHARGRNENNQSQIPGRWKFAEFHFISLSFERLWAGCYFFSATWLAGAAGWVLAWVVKVCAHSEIQPLAWRYQHWRPPCLLYCSSRCILHDFLWFQCSSIEQTIRELGLWPNFVTNIVRRFALNGVHRSVLNTLQIQSGTASKRDLISSNTARARCDSRNS